MWQINDQACVVYRAKPYDDVVTNFCPMRQYPKYRCSQDGNIPHPSLSYIPS